MSIEKVTPWLPLLIAAGYFLFLVATWQRFITNTKAIDEKFETWMAQIQPKPTTETEP